LIKKHEQLVVIGGLQHFGIEGLCVTELATKEPGAELSGFPRVILALELNQ